MQMIVLDAPRNQGENFSERHLGPPNWKQRAVRIR
jgi:hypothetical protein